MTADFREIRAAMFQTNDVCGSRVFLLLAVGALAVAVRSRVRRFVTGAPLGVERISGIAGQAADQHGLFRFMIPLLTNQ